MKRLLSILLLAALSATPTDAQPRIDTEAVIAAFDAADPAAIAGMYTEDAIVRMWGEPPLKTRQALQTYYKEAADAGLPAMVNLELDEVIELSDEFAYVSGSYDLRQPDESTTISFAALLRHVDSQWLLHRVLAFPETAAAASP